MSRVPLDRFPKELFRLNNGSSILLRIFEGPLRPQRSFDVLTTKGMVLPKALNPATYEAPNGASMRPNTPKQQHLARTFKGKSVYVWAVPEGTKVPDDLLLFHEHGDHYALQAREKMTGDELNTKLNNFLNEHAQRFTQEEWCERYPQATESE